MSFRKLALVTLVVSGILVLPATGGFSSASVDRGMKVAIAPDGSAYVGFEHDTSNINDTTNTADLEVTITNQLGSEQTLDTVNVTVDSETKDLGPLGQGNPNSATFEDVPCESTIYVEASGSGVVIEFDRKVEC